MFRGFQPRAELQKYTMVPNEFFDEVMKNVETMAELKVILAVFRKTYGWLDRVENGVAVYKIEDDISYSQFRQMTDLSDTAISDGLKRAIEHGYIIKIKTGGLNDGSSRYRLKQNNDRTTEPEPSIEKINPSDILSDFQPEGVDKKEALLAELIGVNKDEEEPKKKKDKVTFKSKPIQKWNCNDVLGYFADRYKEFVGIPYPMISGKDRSLGKRLLEESRLSTLDIIRAIDFYLKNYKSIKGTPEGFPSWSIFYGWRNTIIPMALIGNENAKPNTSNKAVREYQEPEKDVWVPDSWE